MPETTFAERFKKARSLSGLTQKELAVKIGISNSAANEIEAGYRNTLRIGTVKKLITVLDENILLDDYHRFVLYEQKSFMENLLNKYGITKLCNKLKSHHSSVYRWINGEHQITRAKYEVIKQFDCN